MSDDLTRTIEYIRGLLVSHSCLPPQDPHLAALERWLTRRYNLACPDREHAAPHRLRSGPVPTSIDYYG